MTLLIQTESRLADAPSESVYSSFRQGCCPKHNDKTTRSWVENWSLTKLPSWLLWSSFRLISFLSHAAETGSLASGQQNPSRDRQMCSPNATPEIQSGFPFKDGVDAYLRGLSTGFSEQIPSSARSAVVAHLVRSLGLAPDFRQVSVWRAYDSVLELLV